MSIFLRTLAVTSAAFCIWLTVRIVNRRERWAKWALATAIGLPVLDIVSFGPVVWLTDRGIVARDRAAAIYSPVFAELRVDDAL